MTTARGFLRRLLAGGRGSPGGVDLPDPEALERRAAADRLEAAKQRLKLEIPPLEEDAPGAADKPSTRAPADVDDLDAPQEH